MDDYLYLCTISILIALLLFRFIVIEEQKAMYVELNNTYTQLAKIKEQLDNHNLQLLYYISDLYNYLNTTTTTY
jgi:hypothetical protein